MLTLSGMIVANVGTDYINTYLKSVKENIIKTISKAKQKYYMK